MTPRVALKIDIDTYVGLRDGVPTLARLLEARGLRASFFVSCGPDHSGRAIRRVFRPGFLAKMLRTNAPSFYGWRTILYGTLLPGPQIARSFPDLLRGLVDSLHRLMIGREPDLTVLIDMDPETGLARALGRNGTEERFEDFGADMQKRMRAGFLSLAAEFPNRFRTIDGNRAIDEVAAQVRAVVAPVLA